MSPTPPVTRRPLTPEETDQAVGARIRALLDRHNHGLDKADQLTQAKLADSLGVSRPYISQVISGTRPLLRENLTPLAKRLRVHPHAIAFPEELPPRRRNNGKGIAA